MYNSEFKEQFISENIKNKYREAMCRLVFEAFAPYEEKWEADLCTRPEEDLKPVVESISGLRSNSIHPKLNILKDYVEWCLKQNYPGVKTDMLGINEVGLSVVKKQTIAFPKELQNYLDSIFAPDSEESADCVYRCYYWLAFMGIDEQDILSITCKDVDIANKKLLYRSKSMELSICDPALKAFEVCQKDYFMWYHPSQSIGPSLRERIEGDWLLRPVLTMHSSNRQSGTSDRGGKVDSRILNLRAETSRKSKLKAEQTGLRLSYSRVKVSGLFFRMYLDEMIGKTPDFEAVVREETKYKTYKLDIGRNRKEAVIRRYTKSYEKDYQRWKLAHSLRV